jgi:hypothetical protein
MARQYEDCRQLIDGKFPKTCICNSEKVVGAVRHQKMDELAKAYNDILAEIALDYQSRNYDDFTVVYDPSLGYANVSQGKRDQISGADCFHPSVGTHNRAGIRLWNNMFQPQSEKRPIRLEEFAVHCPDGNYFLG